MTLCIADLALLGCGGGEAGAGDVRKGVTVTAGGSLECSSRGGWGLGLLHVGVVALLLRVLGVLEGVGAVVSDVSWTTTEGAGLPCRLLVDVVLQFEGTMDAVCGG